MFRSQQPDRGEDDEKTRPTTRKKKEVFSMLRMIEVNVLILNYFDSKKLKKVGEQPAEQFNQAERFMMIGSFHYR